MAGFAVEGQGDRPANELPLNGGEFLAGQAPAQKCGGLLEVRSVVRTAVSMTTRPSSNGSTTSSEDGNSRQAMVTWRLGGASRSSVFSASTLPGSASRSRLSRVSDTGFVVRSDSTQNQFDTVSGYAPGIRAGCRDIDAHMAKCEGEIGLNGRARVCRINP